MTIITIALVIICHYYHNHALSSVLRSLYFSYLEAVLLLLKLLQFLLFARSATCLQPFEIQTGIQSWRYSVYI